MIIPETDDRRLPGGIFAGIRPENLRIGRDRSVRVKLRPPWGEFFADLPPLGVAYRQTRAPGIMLGQWSIYPGTGFATEGPASSRELLFDPAVIEAVYAFKSAVFGEDYFGFEVFNRNAPLHRISIPHGEGIGAFSRIVRTHQARIENGSYEVGDRECAEAPWQNGVRHRLNLLRQCPPEVFAKAAPDVLPILMEMARSEEMMLRTTVYTLPLIQAAEWIPRCVEHRQDGVFAYDEDTSLHVCPGQISSGCLTVLKCRCCDRKRATLEFFDDTGRLNLAITSAEVSGDAAWGRLLARLNTLR